LLAAWLGAAFAAIGTALVGMPQTIANADPKDDMGRWAPDERWTKWQEDIDRGYSSYRRKDYALADKIYLKALDKARKYADNPSKVVEVLAKLIVSMIDQGAVEAAEPYYKEVLTLATNLNKKGTLDEMGAICMEDLGTAYDEHSGIRKEGVTDYSKARARSKFLLKHAIAIRANVFSQNHPKLVLERSDLANLCIVDHEWASARAELEKIRETMKEMTGKGWIYSARYVIFLGCVLDKLGKKTEAESAFADVQKHFAAARVTGEMEKYRGNFYRMAGETDNAEAWYRKELAAALKEGHKYEEMISNRNIGYCNEDRDKPAVAEKYFRHALDLAMKHLKVDATNKFTDLISDIERTLRAQKKYKEADRFHAQEIDFLRVKNPRFKTSTQLYQEEIDILKDLDSASRKK